MRADVPVPSGQLPRWFLPDYLGEEADLGAHLGGLRLWFLGRHQRNPSHESIETMRRLMASVSGSSVSHCEQT